MMTGLVDGDTLADARQQFVSTTLLNLQRRAPVLTLHWRSFYNVVWSVSRLLSWARFR